MRTLSTFLTGLGHAIAFARASFPSSITPEQFGATGDGKADDTVALQAALDALQDGQELRFSGTYRITSPLFCSSKNFVTLDFRGSRLQAEHSAGCALLVHGGVMDRNIRRLTQQLIDSPYEGRRPSIGVTIKGFRSFAVTGRRATQLFLFFLQQADISAAIFNSNGSGVEFRQCEECSFDEIIAEDFHTFGLFLYQSYRITGRSYTARDGGRAYDIKQRHKFHESLEHEIDLVTAENLSGFDDTAWAVGGGTYNDYVRYGGSPAAQLNRNFPGHEICRSVRIRRHLLVVRVGAGREVSTPSVHIGAFADGWLFDSIQFFSLGRPATTIPLIIGDRGDIEEGRGGGATFGGFHRIGSVVFSGFQFDDETPLISYGVSCTISAASLRNCSVNRIVYPAPAKSRPLSKVAEFGFSCEGDVQISDGPIGERGIVVGGETVLLRTGNIRLKVERKHRTGNQACSAMCVKAESWIVEGIDEIEIKAVQVPPKAAAAVYAIYTSSKFADLRLMVTVIGGKKIRALTCAGGSTVRLRPSKFELGGVAHRDSIAVACHSALQADAGQEFRGPWGQKIQQ